MLYQGFSVRNTSEGEVVSKYIQWLIVSFFAVLALVHGRELLIPFVLATIVWFVTRELKLLIRKIPVVSKFIPSIMETFLAFLLILIVIYGVLNLLTSSLAELSSQSDTYEKNLDNILAQVESVFHIGLLERVKSFADNLDVVRVLNTLINGLTQLLGDFFMVTIYVLFLFLEESSFKTKLYKLFPESDRLKKAEFILGEVEQSLSQYLLLKTYVSLLTGVLSFFALLAIGIDSAFFWAFLIFALNYIPTIGSLVATFWPAVFSLLQTGSFTSFALILALVGAIQVVVGNVVEPRLMGKSLNLSPLVTIFSLALWGKLWGITGMVLCVPITVILVIVLAQFDSTKKISILLSADGNV